MPKDLGKLEVKRQGTTKTFWWLVTYVPHVWLYLCYCVSWLNDVLMWVIILFIGSVSSFMKYVSQTSKNVYDVRKVSLETTLCVLCFIEFYVFVLDEWMWRS